MTSDDGRWLHLHPIALVVALIDSAKAAVTLILAMAAIALSKRDSPVVVATALVIIILLAAWMVIAPFARWRATTYLLDEDGVTLRSGVFNRKRVTIAYDRIHTVSSSMPFYAAVRCSHAAGDRRRLGRGRHHAGRRPRIDADRTRGTASAGRRAHGGRKRSRRRHP
uniref:PH domain-containing protein n=1 Tax=uncultured Bifidobacterium sp. TaxID=165187 RepID=UPI002598B34C